MLDRRDDNVDLTLGSFEVGCKVGEVSKKKELIIATVTS